VAANRFFQDGAYQFFRSGPATRTPIGMGEFYHDLVQGWPVRSIEDGMADQDFEGWLLLSRRLGHRVQLVGGDLFSAHCDWLAPGGAQGLANAVRVHPGQAGTLSETFDALTMARKAGYRLILGHRPGATEDAFIVDLAVGAGVGQIKCGGVFRGEHTSKHNRLIMLEKKLQGHAPFKRFALLGIDLF
jgi:enolase